MVEDRQALLHHYEEMRTQLLAAIDGLGDAQLSEPSLDGWSVKDHLAHIALWDEIRVAEVHRISAGFESTWQTNGEGDDVYNDLGHVLRANLSVAQALWELKDTRERFVAAVEKATARGLDGSLYGEAGLKSDHEAQHTEWIRNWRTRLGL